MSQDKDPLGAFDPALMGPPSPTRAYRPYDQPVSPVFGPSDATPYRTTEPSSSLHPYHALPPSTTSHDDHTTLPGVSPHSPPPTAMPEEEAAVDPQLEAMFAQQSAPGAIRDADVDDVEDMFGILTNGGGEGAEFEFDSSQHHHRDGADGMRDGGLEGGF
jgi:hypothetical protein